MRGARLGVRSTLLAVSFGAVLQVGGCGGDAVGGSGPITLEKLPERYASVYCDALTGCCDPFDRDLCLAFARGTFSQLTASSDNFVYDAVAAGRCLDEIRGKSMCAGSSPLTSSSSCETVFQGKLAPGGACDQDVECQVPAGGGAECTEDAGGIKRCVQELRGAAGADCYWTCDEQPGSTYCSAWGSTPDATVIGRCYLQDGLFCSDAGTCQPIARIGGDCPQGRECEPGAYCSFPDAKCVALGAKGAACQGSDECEAGLYCDGTSCVPTLAVGATCSSTSECGDGLCDFADATAQTGTCVAFGPDFCGLFGGQATATPN